MLRMLSRLLLVLLPLAALLPVLLVSGAAFALGRGLFGVLFVAMAALEVFVAIRARRRAHAERSSGPSPADGTVLLPGQGHEELWEEVEAIATAAGVPAPVRIRLSLEALAAVAPVQGTDRSGPHGTAAASLDPGFSKRSTGYELVLSPVLLAEAPVSELRAIMAHEIGHVAAGAVRTTGETAFLSWVDEVYGYLTPGLVKLGAWAHLRLWSAVAGRANRPGELRADELAYRIAGPAATAAALRRTATLDAAMTVVEGEYLSRMIMARTRAVLLEAVGQVIREGHRDLPALIEAESTSSITSTHPSLPTRIALATAALGHIPEGPVDDRPAHELVTGGWPWLAFSEVDQLAADSMLREFPVRTWDDVMSAWIGAGLADACDVMAQVAAAPLDAKGRPPRGDRVGVPAVSGGADAVTARTWLEAAASGGGVGFVLRDDTLTAEDAAFALGCVGARSLARAGLLRLDWDWTGRVLPEYRDGDQWLPLASASPVDADRITDPDGTGSPLDQAIHAVASDGSQASVLVGLLEVLGADVDAPIGPSPDERRARVGSADALHCQVEVSRDGAPLPGRHVLLVSSTGLWIVPESPASGMARVVAAERERERRDLMDRLVRAMDLGGKPDLVQWPESVWLPQVDLARVEAAGRIRIRLEVTTSSGATYLLRLPASAQTMGDLPDALHTLAGAKLHLA